MSDKVFKVGDKVNFTDYAGRKWNAEVISTHYSHDPQLEGVRPELKIKFLPPAPEGVHPSQQDGPQGSSTMIINDMESVEKVSGGRRRRKTRKPRRKIRNTRRYRK